MIWANFGKLQWLNAGLQSKPPVPNPHQSRPGLKQIDYIQLVSVNEQRTVFASSFVLNFVTSSVLQAW
jgi:hypothetical protein